jgi:hypothetical protein
MAADVTGSAWARLDKSALLEAEEKILFALAYGILGKPEGAIDVRAVADDLAGNIGTVLKDSFGQGKRASFFVDINLLRNIVAHERPGLIPYS